MSKFSERLKRLHSSRVRAEQAAEDAEAERASVYTADDVAEQAAPPTRSAGRPRGVGFEGSAELSAWEAVGATRESGFVSFERRHEPSLGHGRFSIGDAASAELPAISREILGLFSREASLKHAIFIDIETAGLGDGPGNEAWCVGLGWFEDRSFVVRHIVMTHPRDETAALRAAAELIWGAKVLVTFNGATFDLPRLSSHFERCGIADPIADADHIDLLKVARRLFPAGEQTNLPEVERRLLGFERRHDVPGSESPRRWSSYLRTLNVRPLLPLIEHNRLDIVSLAVALAYIAELMTQNPGSTRESRPRVDRQRPVEPPRTEWASPEVEPKSRTRDQSEPSDFRKKLVRSYRLKSKSERSKSTVRRQPGKKVDPPRVAETRAGSTSSAEAVGERLTALRREAARLLQTGNDAEAIPILHEMVALSPRNPFPLAELARYYRAVGDADLAQLFEARLNDVAPY